MYVYMAILLVLLVCSAMMSGAETALFSLNPTHINKIKKRFSKSDQMILKLLKQQDYTLATVLIANNLVNICIVILSNTIMNKVIDFGGSATWEFIIKVVVVTFLLLLFGEMMPKIFATYNPLKFSRLVSMPIYAMREIFRPLSYVLIKSSSGINQKVSHKKEVLSIDELSNAIQITQNHSDEEKKMLSGIVNFSKTEVSEIMKLRMDIVGIDITSTYSGVKKTIIESGFSRIPVYEENIDSIKGILYVKDMLPHIDKGDEFVWRNHIRNALFVPEHKKINDLLEEFQATKVHLAIVVDEYGATQGLLSLEDILEEIVGEIVDETDVEQPKFYKKIDDSTYIFEGKTHLCDVENVLKLRDDYFEEVGAGAETVAGLMLEVKRDFLKVGETVTSKGVKFTVEALDGHRIDKVKITLIEQKS